MRSSPPTSFGKKTFLVGGGDNIRRHKILRFAVAQGFIAGQPGLKQLVAPGFDQGDFRAQTVGIRDVIIGQIPFVRDALEVKSQAISAAQIKAACGKEMPAVVIRANVVFCDAGGDCDLAISEGLPISQVKRLASFRDKRGDGQVAMIPHFDEIRNFDPSPEIRTGRKPRHQKPGRPIQCWVRKAQGWKVEHRHIKQTQLRAFQIELFFLLIMGDALCANCPDRGATVLADIAGGQR